MKKNFSFFLLFFLVIGFGYYFFYSKTFSERQTVVFKKPSPSLKKITNFQQDKWRVYENKKFNYRISWHLDWHKQKENEPPYPAPPVGMNFSRDFGQGEVCDFEILASDIKDNFQGEIDYFQQKPEYQKEEITLAGEKALRFILKRANEQVEHYYFTHHDKAYRMGLIF